MEHGVRKRKSLKFRAKQWLRLMLGAICSLFITLFLLLSIPVYLYRFLIILAAKRLRPEFGEILSSVSALLVADLFSGKPPRATLVLTGAFQGSFDKNKAKEVIANGWIRATDKNTGKLLYAKFQQHPYSWMGFRFWANNPKDRLDDHLHFHTNLGSNDSFVSNDDVNEFVEKLLNEPFPTEKSPWALHFIENYKNNGKLSSDSDLLFIVILKIHHSLADGFSILAAVMEGLCDYPMSKIKLAQPQYPKRTFTQNLIYLPTLPFRIIYDSVQAFSNVFRPCPWKAPNRTKAWRQFSTMSSEPVPLENVKLIKDTFGVAFSSVMVSLTSAALSRNLEEKKKVGMWPEEDEEDSVFLCSPAPVPNHSHSLTNHFTTATFDIPIKRFTDSVDRLRTCDDLQTASKKSTLGMVANVAFALIGGHLSPVCDAALRNNTMYAVGITSFASLPFPLEKHGGKGVNIGFVAGMVEGTMGVGFEMISYDQNIQIGVTAEESVMSREELNDLLRYLTEEVETLYTIARKTKVDK